MKETKNLREQLETAYEPTPEAFHRRVQDTLGQLRRMDHQEETVMKRKIRWGALALAALLLVSAIGAAAKLGGVFDFITHTAAKNWVLDEARDMLHEDVSRTEMNDCVITLREWVCDGERLYVCVSVVDPALETEGHYVPEDEDEDYLGGLNYYGLRYGPGDVSLSEGEVVGGMTWDFMWGDEENNEILYVFEQSIANVPDAFTVSIPLTCSAGENSVRFNVTRADFGRVRNYAPSDATRAQGYTAQITRFRATALRTYAELTLTFEESAPADERRRIVSDYMDGLGVPEGRLDAVAGEGEEILLAHTARWSPDERTCVVSLDGNPRETFPECVVYCPRWGMADYDWDQPGEMPPLSMDGAVVMNMKEAK